MSLLNVFKKVDKLIGTPLCYFLGLANREKSPPKNPKNILLIKLIAMGDIIVLLPSVHAIRNKYPDTKITFLTTPAMTQLVKHSPDIDSVITLNIPKDINIFGLGKFISKIRALRFDVAIDFEQYYRLTGLIMWLAHIPYRVGFDISGQGRNTMLTTKVKYNDTIHEVENFGRLVETIGATKPTQLISPVFKSASADAEYIKRLLSKQKTVVIHPGTSSAATSRRWPAKNFAKLADALAFHGYRIIFTGADEEKPIIKKIILASQQSHTNLVGKTSLSQLLELFKQVKLVISLDTGPLHLAASTDTPVLGLYGANTPIKWGPYGRQHKAIYHGPFPPCTQQQYGRVCNHKEEYHMQNITSNEVLDTALNMLKTKS